MRKEGRSHELIETSPGGTSVADSPSGMPATEAAALRVALQESLTETDGTRGGRHTGCGRIPTRATSRLGGGTRAGGITLPVHPLLFLRQVVRPIRRPVAITPDGAKFQNRLGPGETPSGSRDIESIFHQMATGALNDAGRNRPALRQGRRVV